MRQETAHAKAERIILVELARLGLREADLALRRKHEPGKLQMATRLRKETTLTVKQIAQQLHLGTPRSASLRLLTAVKKANFGDPAQGRLRI